MGHRNRACLAALALASGLALPACEQRPEPPPDAPNVLMIVLDTLRADHLSCYGYRRTTSPEIDTLGDGATRFAHCQATAPWTLPTHASIFTGRFPFEHGAHTVPVDTKRENAAPLSGDNVTIAEALSEEGYDTAGFVANKFYLAPDLGMDQGFRAYENDRKLCDEMTPRAISWLEERGERPWFLFLNYMDTHCPYNAARDGRWASAEEFDNRELMNELYEEILGTPPDAPLPEEKLKTIRDEYDASIARVDASLGRLFDWLRDAEIWDDTVIVLTSDHGEYFGEHKLIEHSKDVYQEALRVPLIVKARGQRDGAVEDTRVSSVDIANLVVRELPTGPRERWMAHFSYAPGNRPELSENHYTRIGDLFGRPWSARFDRVRRTLVLWPWKYIASTDGENELYDLSADPGESTNLVAEKPELVERMAAALARYSAAEGPGRAAADATYSEDELAELRELGYF